MPPLSSFAIEEDFGARETYDALSFGPGMRPRLYTLAHEHMSVAISLSLLDFRYGRFHLLGLTPSGLQAHALGLKDTTYM